MLNSKDSGRAISVRRWTQTAIDCYKRGCVCSDCFYFSFFKNSAQKCQMKASVIELVRILGKPNVITQEILDETPSLLKSNDNQIL